MDQAPRTEAVSAPLPDELRPYIVLHTEIATLPPGSRFGGHWVTAWRSRLPFVQIDRARSHEVGRCIPFRGDGDAEAMRALLADAACLIAADETWLETAADLGTPTIYLADGHADAVPLPAALQGFASERLQVLRSNTNFRRDLPLRLLNEALERFVPGVTGEDRSESSLCRDRLQPYLGGRIADLGHGGHKISPDAVGVDFFKFDAWDWIGDVRDLWFCRDQSFDSVYSSHCLEDLWLPHQALAEWTRILRPGGHLSLFLPLRDFYPNVGTAGANPGHKDDYVPEDVERFLRELGHMEVVHAARVERENSFEVVARKKAGRSFFLARGSRPKPEVSVLLVADPSGNPAADADAIGASVAAAQAAFASIAHEVLILDRTRSDGDARAAVHDLAARDARVHVIADRRPLPYGARWEVLRRAAAGEALLVLQPGTLLAPDAGAALLAALQQGNRAALPAARDALGRCHGEAATAGCCLLLSAAAWPVDALGDTTYGTARLWHEVARRHAAVTVPAARVVTAAEVGRPAAARGLARMGFDQRQIDAEIDAMAPPPSQSLLVVMLRTLGDCVLATPVLTALHKRHPGARITVLTEPAYAWIFALHPAVDAVRTTPALPGRELFWAEDRAVAAALAETDCDRLVLLSDRLENVTYHHSGLALADFYAVQAGVPEAAGQPPEVHLDAAAGQRWQQRRSEHDLSGRYAVIHTRAGWAEKSIQPALAVRLAEELIGAGLRPVAIGGPGERVDHPGVCNLAGELSMVESAAAIAGAELFVGPDSGPLHLASAFGVRSLALYGGSHLRVAPPRAIGSCSLQAASCCPVPCGVTPCPERHCGAYGLASDAVLPRLQAVIADGVGGDAEFWGSEPLLCAESKDGAWLVDSVDEHFAGTPMPPLATATDRGSNAPSTAAAAVTPLTLDVTLPALARHAQQSQQLHASAGPAGPHAADTGTVLESIRHAVAPADGLTVLRALASQCRALESGHGALQSLAAAIGHCGAMVRGERGRPRAAYRTHADALLHDALNIHIAEPAGSRLRRQLFDIYREATGSPPDRDHILHAVACSTDEAEVPPELVASLRQHLGASQPHHGQALRWATMLRRAKDPAAAADLMTAHLRELPEAATTEIAEARFLRGTCLVAAEEALAALDDMRFAAAALQNPKDCENAAQIVAVLERHLASAPTRA